jgi:hypothetical protein
MKKPGWWSTLHDMFTASLLAGLFFCVENLCFILMGNVTFITKFSIFNLLDKRTQRCTYFLKMGGY